MLTDPREIWAAALIAAIEDALSAEHVEQYVTLAGCDEHDLRTGREYVWSVLHMNYASAAALEN